MMWLRNGIKVHNYLITLMLSQFYQDLLEISTIFRRFVFDHCADRRTTAMLPSFSYVFVSPSHHLALLVQPLDVQTFVSRNVDKSFCAALRSIFCY